MTNATLAINFIPERIGGAPVFAQPARQLLQAFQKEQKPAVQIEVEDRLVPAEVIPISGRSGAYIVKGLLNTGDGQKSKTVVFSQDGENGPYEERNWSSQQYIKASILGEDWLISQDSPTSPISARNQLASVKEYNRRW